VNPFFYSWLSQLRYCPDPNRYIAAVAYDVIGESGRLLINEEKFATLRLSQQIFVLTHELLHWVYEHPGMEELRTHKQLMNVAMDIAINETLLRNPKADMPEGVTLESVITELEDQGVTIDRNKVPPKTAGTMDFFNWLREIQDELESGGHAGGSQAPSGGSGGSGETRQSETEADPSGDPGEEGGGSGTLPDETPDGEGLSPGEALEVFKRVIQELQEDHEAWEKLEGDPQLREGVMHQVVMDIQEAKSDLSSSDLNKYCGDFAAAMERLIKAVQNKQIPWQNKLRRFVGYCGKMLHKATYSQFNKYRQLPKLKLLPGTKGVCIFDTSGSMGRQELGVGWGQIERICAQGVELDVIEFDSVVYEDKIRTFKKGREYVSTGGGGTNFTEAFRWLRKNWKRRGYAFAIVYTDGFCGWPPASLVPDTKRVLWLMTTPGRSAPAYCGESLHIKI
jgi:predicted metal-dependent peptidase